jgi:hypothetical protein
VQWQLLHVEKDDQVIRHNNNKTWETKEKSIRKAFLFKTLVKNCFAEKYLFCFAGSVLFSLLFVYYFCTIFVIYQKNWLRYHPLGGAPARVPVSTTCGGNLNLHGGKSLLSILYYVQRYGVQLNQRSSVQSFRPI